MRPRVSILIPCRNEEKTIAQCLDSIISNDYPKGCLEVLVIDGMSDDGTREAVGRYAGRHDFIRLIDNEKKIVPAALNKGIQNSSGQIIIRMDAHSTYDSSYISKCVASLLERGADNVGGVCVTKPLGGSVVSSSIALGLSHFFGVGNSHFRTGRPKTPRYVDTVPFGCYRKDVFEKAGLFNEKMVRNQDIEFNLRLKRNGGRILLVPEIVSHYYARPTLKELFRQNFRNGFWVLYGLRFARLPFSARHFIPFLFVLSLLLPLGLSFFYGPFMYLFGIVSCAYILSDLYFSSSISFKKGIRHLPALLVVFPTLHISYGLGSLWGAVKLAVSPPHD